MAFSLNGTHIEGGTFNNVAGNMTQVFDVVHTHSPADVVNDSAVESMHSSAELLDTHSAPLAGQASNVLPADSANRNPEYVASHPQGIPGAFNSVGGDMTQLNIHSYGETGIDILYHSVVPEALHDSGERFTEPACHLGTRTVVLEELRSWSIASCQQNMILWLHGSAGMGKSAIAQAFAGDCQRQGRLGASFFFKRGDPRRGTWHSLFPTIAYQLATSVSHLLLPVQRVVEGDKLISGRQMSIQFDKLLVETFNVPHLPFNPVIVLDGLDECADHKIQQQILRLFIGAIQTGQLPIRLLIASRPEPHLREIMETEETFAICRTYALSADSSAREDIATYLRDEFTRIHCEHQARGVDLGHHWPDAYTVARLAEKASGIFIYATTVIRYIDDEYSHPSDRLASVLALDPRSTAPLDDLYTEILSVVPPDPQQLRIIHALWKGIMIFELQMNPEDLDSLLSLRPGTSRLAVRALHSVLSVPPIRRRFHYRGRIYPLHASLGDYLADPRRSGPWCASLPWLHEDYFRSIVRLISSPRVTIDAHIFHGGIILGLPKLFSYITPSDHVLGLLRSEAFQDSIFLGTSQGWWGNVTYPQKDSGYPRDLIQLWDDHRFISTLTRHMKLTPEQASPTCEFDSIYYQILSRHPDLLRVLRSQIVRQDSWWRVLELLRPHGNYRVFQPFLAVRDLLKLPFPPGDSPIDFLNDPRRSGPLYWAAHRIAEDQVVLWTQYTKSWITQGQLGFSTSWMCLLDLCSSCPLILQELATLDLAQLCTPIPIRGDEHHKVHTDAFTASDRFQHVLDWLKRFSPPPLQTISFWETQIANIWQCSGNRFGEKP